MTFPGINSDIRVMAQASVDDQARVDRERELLLDLLAILEYKNGKNKAVAEESKDDE